MLSTCLGSQKVFRTVLSKLLSTRGAVIRNFAPSHAPHCSSDIIVPVGINLTFKSFIGFSKPGNFHSELLYREESMRDTVIGGWQYSGRAVVMELELR